MKCKRAKLIKCEKHEDCPFVRRREGWIEILRREPCYIQYGSVTSHTVGL